jgi:hypothetical protein
LPAPTHCPEPLATSRSHWRSRAGRAERDAGAPRRRPAASPVADASRSCRSRSPSRPAAVPRGCRYAVRTGCRSVQRGRSHEGDRPAASAARSGAAVPPLLTAHRIREVRPSTSNSRSRLSMPGEVSAEVPE